MPKSLLELSEQERAELARFGRRIAAKRELRRMTQMELAEALGVSQSTVSHIEQGKWKDLAIVLRLLRVLAAKDEESELAKQLGVD